MLFRHSDCMRIGMVVRIDFEIPNVQVINIMTLINSIHRQMRCGVAGELGLNTINNKSYVHG